MGMGLGNSSMGGDNFKSVFIGLGMDLPFPVYVRVHGHKATHIFDTWHKIHWSPTLESLDHLLSQAPRADLVQYIRENIGSLLKGGGLARDGKAE